MTAPVPTPVLLCILDGWGIADAAEDNAITRAHTPVWDGLLERFPHARLGTSGLDVGLPDGQMGNSEVGHMNIGAGRVMLQDLPRIDTAIADGSLAGNAELQQLIATLKKTGGVCHLAGLCSPGGVHAHQDHIVALAKIVSEAGVPVRLHAFLDGRDTPPSSAAVYMQEIEQALALLTDVAIATVSGRYYAMDRDNRWDRVEKAFSAMVHGKGGAFETVSEAIASSYRDQVTDEFVLPAAIAGYQGMQEGDGFLFANFRADRARQLSHALLDPAFDGFARPSPPKLAAACCMAEYSSALNAFYSTLFPPEDVQETLGEVVAAQGLTQLRIAETEKYAHVTFFMNGGREAVFDGEERTLIPSPDVATYDLKPEMSAPEVTDKLVDAITGGGYALIIANYANTDMVGHTGDIEAAVKAVEAVDSCLGRILEAIETSGGVLCITADHGNAEMMFDEATGDAHTAHTTNLVPFVVAGNGMQGRGVRDGRLADIAPTLLSLLQLPVPGSMTGENLLG